MQSKRKLAAIMFTDIVGYTKMMQHSESSAIRVRKKHREVFNSCNDQFRGQLIQYFGDGTLSIFDSAVDAVRCAVSIQEQLHNEPYVPLRIGIHLGDIIVSDEDIIGDSVNIASRIESLSVAGAILISNSVKEAIKNQDDLIYQHLGSFHLKNDEQPRDIYALAGADLVIPQVESIKARGKLETEQGYSEIRSIAVIPFDNYSGDSSLDYLVSGMHDHLITVLSHIKSLRVISRTSSLRFKAVSMSVREIADELNVDAVLEAAVTEIGDRVKLNVQMIKTYPEEDHVWAKFFDYSMGEIYALYHEISSIVAAKINLRLEEQELSFSSMPERIDLQAYRAFLRGKFHWEKLSGQDFKLAREYFNTCIQLEPTFAPAYAALASTILAQVQMGLVSPVEAMPQIYKYNQEALALDPMHSDAHYMSALLGMAVEWNWEKSESAFLKSLDSNPNNSLAHAFYGHLLLVQKRFDKAISAVRSALSLDPNNPLVQSLSGIVHFHSGNTEEALELAEASSQVDPNNILTLRLLELCHYELGNFQKAYEYELKIQDQDPMAKEALKKGYLNKNHTQAMELLAEAKATQSESQYVQPVWVAKAYLRAGRYDDAINWMEKGYQMHDQDMPYIFLASKDQKLAANPRFQALARRMNLPI